MKKRMIAVVVGLLVAWFSFANAEEMVFSGETGGAGATLGCTPSGDGVSLKYNPGGIVRTLPEGAKPGFVKTHDDVRRKDVYVLLSSIPDGTKVYIFGLAVDWGKMSTNVDKLDLNVALASGTYQGGAATIALPYVKKDGKTFTHAMVNAVAVLPDGTRAWAGIDGTQYTVEGGRGPFFLVPKSCAAPSAEAKKNAQAVERARTK